MNERTEKHELEILRVSLARIAQACGPAIERLPTPALRLGGDYGLSEQMFGAEEQVPDGGRSD